MICDPVDSNELIRQSQPMNDILRQGIQISLASLDHSQLLVTAVFAELVDGKVLKDVARDVVR